MFRSMDIAVLLCNKPIVLSNVPARVTPLVVCWLSCFILYVVLVITVVTLIIMINSLRACIIYNTFNNIAPCKLLNCTLCAFKKGRNNTQTIRGGYLTTKYCSYYAVVLLCHKHYFSHVLLTILAVLFTPPVCDYLPGK